jgi:geranylgeranylglycerol-phosphate geranylgeranyltransferase
MRHRKEVYSVKPFLRLPILCRPLNCLITFCSVWIAAIVAGHSIYSNRILAASLSAALITAYGNVVNDLFDIKADTINKPYRPLVRGDVDRRTAIVIAIALALIGLALSIVVGSHAYLVAMLVIILLLVYTPIFKGMSYIGNILVAVVSSLAFIYGGMAVDKPFGALILVAFAFLLHLGREIVKDIQDRYADSAAGHCTGACIADGSLSRMLASVVLAILIAATFIPFFAKLYGLGYLIVVVIGTDIIIAESIHRLIITGDEAAMRQISLWLKFAMPFGLLAVLLGQIGL